MKKTRTNRPRLATSLLLLLTSVHLVGCGTLLFPDRRGQESGRVDPNVVLMDGLLLLLYVVPGVVAYVVDYTTGAIYLPAGSDGEGPIVGDGALIDD